MALSLCLPAPCSLGDAGIFPLAIPGSHGGCRDAELQERLVGTARGLFTWAVTHLDEQQLLKEIGATEVTADE